MTKTKTENLPGQLPDFHLSSYNHHVTTPLRFLFAKNMFHLIVQDAASLDQSPTEIHHYSSSDLIHWGKGPVVYQLPQDPPYNSGTVILDLKNTCGYGTSSKTAWILVFSSPDANNNTLRLMYSIDGGNTWTAHKNPLLDLKKSKPKDPFIFWHENINKWVMILTFPEEYKVKFYTSKNLLKWDFLNDFGGHPSFKASWEHVCLLPVHVQNVPGKEKWILMVTYKAEYSGVRYFVGDFDGKAFLCDHALDLLLPVDYGKDFYSPRRCVGLYPKRNILIGSMTNTTYATDIPNKVFQNLISTPKEIALNKEADGSYRMIQHFVPELATLRINEKQYAKSPFATEIEWDLLLTDAMEFQLQLDSHKLCTIEFDFSAKTKLLINWDPIKHQLHLDRTARPFGFHAAFPSLETANVSTGHIMDIHILIDKNCIEIVADKGKVSISSLFFAAHPLQRFRIIGKQFAASGTVWNLKKQLK